ncbi:sensor histidine kinase [Occallatibacter riparius]|uniref:histidine kinase n=1 Tax=Occallatibacter riparius TaxID=1002689 RepID=A0A9J7BGW0_9BACT|nr:sensor histidine kinase [Occallatibacter riparius]UWZ82212.1 sensor histidine kinase [Occallatibacter riparius]
MQQIETSQQETSSTARSSQRIVAVVETLAAMKHRGGTVSEVAHDARNMVTALALYCDLLAEPGVLAESHAHYANELRLVAAASRRLVEKLMSLDLSDSTWLEPVASDGFLPQNRLSARPTSRAGSLSDPVPQDRIENLQQDLLDNYNLLDALTGPSVAIGIRTEGGARPVRLSREDLTRVLVNLVKNADEAMGKTGTIEITLRELPGAHGKIATAVLAVEDSGPGIREDMLETIFDSGYTTHAHDTDDAPDGGWPATHHGLGLAITRSLVEAAGGTIRAANRPQGGAQFTIELPVSDQ